MSCGTLVLTDCLTFSLTGLLPALAALSRALRLKSYMSYVSPQPRGACSSVCPLSRSLAATKKIVFTFSSSGYLDVSVPRVSSVKLCIYLTVHTHYYMWVPPFGNLRVIAYLQLTAAYRSLSRPSSAPSAKASALCSSSLDQ